MDNDWKHFLMFVGSVMGMFIVVLMIVFICIASRDYYCYKFPNTNSCYAKRAKTIDLNLVR